jgi:cytochrome c553
MNSRPAFDLRQPLLALLLLAASGCGGKATAQPLPAEPPHLAACRACHGRDGISDKDDIPNLAGQKAVYLARQLQAFRSGERKHALMAAIAAQLDEAEIQALAQAWSRAPAGVPGPVATLSSRMQFPAGFPQGYTLYDREDDIAAGQTQLRYANHIAMQAARSGLPLPSGAIILAVNHALQPGEPPTPGRLLSYAGMAAQAGWGDEVPPLLRNGDWQYALFDAAGVRREPAQQAACLACHKPLAADNHMFTWKALRAAAQRMSP